MRVSVSAPLVLALAIAAARVVLSAPVPPTSESLASCGLLSAPPGKRLPSAPPGDGEAEAKINNGLRSQFQDLMRGDAQPRPVAGASGKRLDEEKTTSSDFHSDGTLVDITHDDPRVKGHFAIVRPNVDSRPRYVPHMKAWQVQAQTGQPEELEEPRKPPGQGKPKSEKKKRPLAGGYSGDEDSDSESSR